MAIFIIRKSKTVIVTSYKVMYTNLRYSNHHPLKLTKIRWSNYYYRYLLSLNRYNQKWHIIMFARNPYHRLLSLYINKFQDYPKKVLSGELNKWEQCHKVLLQESKMPTSPRTIKSARYLTNLPFKDFVNLIEKIQFKEKHFYPQVKSLDLLNIPFYKKKIIPNEVIKIENMDAKRIKEKTDVDLSEKVNVSNLTDYMYVLSPEIKNKIYDLYRVDFQKFRYVQ